MFSTVDGVDGDPSCDAEYWVANLRHPVRFARAVAAASVAHTTFIEISPHPLLTFAISDTLGDTHHHALGTLARDTHDTVSFHTALNTTHTTHPPDTEHPPGPHPQLPTTPWCHSRHWLTTAVTAPVGVNHRGVDGGCVQAAGAGAGADRCRRWCWSAGLVVCAAVGTACRIDRSWRAGWPMVGVRRCRGGCRVGPWPGWRGTGVSAGDPRWGSGCAAGSPSSVVCSGCCMRPPSTGTPIDVAAAYRLFNAARRLTAALVSMAVPARLFIVTRNAQPVVDGDRANPAHAVLWGLGRSIALEHPEIWGGIIDLDESVPAVLAARSVLAEAGARRRRGPGGVSGRGAPRSAAAAPRPPSRAAAVVLDPDTSHLVIGASGKIGPHLIAQLAADGRAHHRRGVPPRWRARRVPPTVVGGRGDADRGGRRCR